MNRHQKGIFGNGKVDKVDPGGHSLFYLGRLQISIRANQIYKCKQRKQFA